MKLIKLCHLNRNNKGFTVIEAIVSLFIISIIGLGGAMANAQVLTQTSRNNDYTTADRQTLNAAYWITNDYQMAQTIQTDGASGFPLTLQWVEWDNTSHEVIYTVENNTIKRSHATDGGQPVITVIASYINPETSMTNCSSTNGTLELKVTATVGEGVRTINVTKVHEITSRPNL